tara:strand:- start:117 stop:794 length:678 start_codon:yes stop_codon:yes gene_type:complete
MALVIVIITSVINFLRANKRYIDQEGYVRDGFNHLIHRNIAFRYNYASGLVEGKYDLPFQYYIVNHLDGNKLNNHPKNLQLFTGEEQKKICALNRKKETKRVEEDKNAALSKKQSNVIIRKKKYNEKIKSLIDKENGLVDDYIESLERRHGHEFIIDNGYIRFRYSLNNPNMPGQFFHIWWYKKNNGPITPGNEIDHIDGNKLNNDIDNLRQMTPEDHRRKHGLS